MTIKTATRWFCYWVLTIPALPWLFGVRYFSPLRDGTVMDELRYAFIEYPTYLFDKD